MLPTDERRRFSKISAVRPGEPDTWEGRTFLTFDIDWADDAVINAVVDMVEQAEVAATWFVTHDTPVLDRLRANPAFELGIHPNFLPLLMAGDPANGASAAEVVDRLLAIVPEATAARAHSLVQSGRLLQLFRDKGLTHDASAFIPSSSGMTLQPWVDWFGIVRVPYGWEDDFWCDSGQESLAHAPSAGIRGWDFHPIHVFLNTEALERYERARPNFRNPDALRRDRNQEVFGTADVLKDLLALSHD